MGRTRSKTAQASQAARSYRPPLPISTTPHSLDALGFTGDVILPASVTTIGSLRSDNGVASYHAFNAMTGIRSFTFNVATLSIIGAGAFSGCTALGYIDMSNCTLGATLTSLSRVVTGSPFLNVTAHTVVYSPSDTTSSLVTASTPNYVLNGQCEWFYAQDGRNYYLPHAFPPPGRPGTQPARRGDNGGWQP